MRIYERDPRGFRTLVENHLGDVKIEALFTQTVTVGRSVTESGEIVSGFPLVLDTFVPIAFFEGESGWRAGAVKQLME